MLDKEKKNIFIIVAAGITLLIIIFLGVTYSNNKQYALNVAKADQFFNDDKFSDAIEYYNTALLYKDNDLLQDKITQSQKIKDSLDIYNKANDYFQSGDYLSAYYAYKQVMPEDTKRYETAQIKMVESKPYFIENEFRVANDLYISKSYSLAVVAIQSILDVDSDNEKAKQLKNIYQKAYDEQKIATQTASKINQEKWLSEMEKTQEIKAAEQQKLYGPQKIVDSNGKQIWKIYINGSLHFTGTYKGTGNFIVKLSDSNQDLITVIANEIGDYIADKTVNVPYVGWYYLEVTGTYGSWTSNWQ